MARIAGVDLPRDKRIEIGLTYIYGIGRVSSNKVLEAAGVDPNTRVKDLTDEEVNIIILKVVYGYTFKELALKISQKPSTISSKYFRAINKFKRSYKEWMY